MRTIREMRPGDKVFIYHSGTNPSVVGLAQVASEPRNDPANSKSAIVDLEYLEHLEPPTPLSEIKNAGNFNDWALLRQSRLSTMAAPPEFVLWLRSRYPKSRI